MQISHLTKSENCATMAVSTAVSPQPSNHDFWTIYLQERRRALLTELRMIEQLQTRINGEKAAK